MSLSIIHSAIHVCTVDKLVTLSPSVHQFNLPYCDWQDDVKSGVGRTRMLRRSNSVNLSMLTWLCTVISVQWRFPLPLHPYRQTDIRHTPRVSSTPRPFRLVPAFLFCTRTIRVMLQYARAATTFSFFSPSVHAVKIRGPSERFSSQLLLFCYETRKRQSLGHRSIIQPAKNMRLSDYGHCHWAFSSPTCHHFSSLGKC